MRIIDSCYKLLEPQSNRIFTTIKIDARSGNESRMKSKIEKIESILNKNVNN